MDRLVYTALSGLRGAMTAQTATANNLANATTIGFRSDRVDFEKLMLKGSGLETRAPTSGEVIDADRNPGAVVHTGRSLDVSMNGEAWLAVQAADGTEAYTRRGDLSVVPSGVLQTGDGFPVLGQNGGPITVPPADKIDIAPDGSVVILPAGSMDGLTQTVDRLKLASPVGTETRKGTDNLLRVKDGGVLPADLDATVQGGSLEQSNVNMTQALVDMIENQRTYEVQSKLLSTVRDLDEGGASLMRLPN